MDAALAETLYPRHWRGVTKNHVAGGESYVPVVFDTETFFARIFAFGFFDGQRLLIHYGIKRDHLAWFLARLGEVELHGGVGVVAAHVLRYDLQVLLWGVLNPFSSPCKGRAPRHSHFSLLKPRATFEIYWDRPCFGSVKIGSKTFHLLDTYAFFGMSLSRSLKAIGSRYRKLKKPRGLGKRIIPKSEISPYLHGDLHGAFALLLQIFKYHWEYKIKLCVSSPMMAGRIFRHHYLSKNFATPPTSLLGSALLSYHGGKNSFPGSPGWYTNCWDLDINSAYAEAMRQLPDFENGRWIYHETKNISELRCHGIYRFRGFCRSCKWGLLFDHSFHRVFGRTEGIWVTGYELLEGCRAGHIRSDDFDIRGWWFQENRPSGYTAFKKYVDDFYEKKKNATDPGQREFYKIMLNSLYGKFIARTEDDDENMVAGSMFDPAIASLITGFVRAKIHRLEHEYDAIHTATDGFITQRKPNPNDVSLGIGKLKCVGFGRCAILRNKLYLHYDTQGKLIKCGLHGFEMGPEKLMQLWKSGKRKYTVDHLLGWKEAWHLGLPPGLPVRREKELKI